MNERNSRKLRQVVEEVEVLVGGGGGAGRGIPGFLFFS